MSQNNHDKIEILDPEKWQELKVIRSNLFWDAPVQYCISLPRKKLAQRYQVRYKFNKKHLFFDIILTLVVLSLIIFNVYFFFGVSPLSFINKVDMQIVFDETSFQSGAVTSFNINYQNNNKELLKQVVLGIHVPQGFELQQVEPYKFNTTNNTVDLGDLPPGATGSVVVTGTLIGDIHQADFIEAFLTYDKVFKHDHSLRLSSSARNMFELNTSVLEIAMPRQPSLPINQEIPLYFELVNHGDTTLHNIVVTEDFNNGIKLVSTDVSYNAHNHQWFIDTLDSGESRRVDFSVQVFKDLLESDNANFEKSLQVYIQKNSHKFLQTQINYVGAYIEPKIVSYTELVNKNYIEKNSEHVFDIVLENHEDQDVYDAAIDVTFPVEIFDINSIQPAGHIEGGHVMFDAALFPQLQLIEPGQVKRFQVKITTLSSFETNHFENQRKNILVELSGAINYHVAHSEQDLIASVTTSWIKLGTDITLNVQGRYFSVEGDQLGRGPYPPIINESTSYWLFFEVTNTSNAVRDARISFTLPAYVELTDRFAMVDAAVSYDKQKRQLTWDIGDVPIYTGSINDSIGLSLEVRAIPLQEYEGEYLPLAQNIRMSGTDIFTEDDFEQIIPNITTDFITDDRAQEKGGRVLLWQ